MIATDDKVFTFDPHALNVLQLNDFLGSCDTLDFPSNASGVWNGLIVVQKQNSTCFYDPKSGRIVKECYFAPWIQNFHSLATLIVGDQLFFFNGFFESEFYMLNLETEIINKLAPPNFHPRCLLTSWRHYICAVYRFSGTFLVLYDTQGQLARQDIGS